MKQNIFSLRIVCPIFIILGISIPIFFVHAEVKITEVAWMGTANSQYEEWIELYNDSADDVALNGWKLFKTGGVTLFSPTGTITAGSYYLICRSTTSITDPLGGTCNEKGTFGGSGLNNTNDQLVLKDGAGAIKESVDASGGWPAGDSSTKQTMQKSGTAWVTAEATPGAETITNTPDPENGPGSDPDQTPNTEPDPDPDPPPSSTPKPKSDPKERIEKIKPDPVYKAHMILPDFGTAGVAIPMKATVIANEKTTSLHGRFEWSMGDGGSYKFIKNTPLEHTFYYPGTYTITMQYYSDRFRTEPDTIHRKTLTIVPDDIEILGYSTTDGLQLQNNSSKEIALDHWIIQSNNQEFIFPKFTIITKGQTLSLSPKTLGITPSRDSILLLNPNRGVVAGYSYKYTQPETPDEAFVDEPDLSQNLSSLTAKEESHLLPKSKSIKDIWHQNKWYVVFGGIALTSVLAYLAFHLYAKPDEELL
jgi:hypothetical protein